ncbi:MAG: ferritin-like domain-containing protein, partial [Myxococcales bacterium]|nr:ferritin-like domain-containing protein [Myxococcales bacterium]
FQTPLIGSFNWSYEDSDRKIRRLYELGKEWNWNATTDVDWSRDFPRSEPPMAPEFNPFAGYPPFEALSEEAQLEFGWHQLAWMLSQFLHGEQGALLVASQLISCAPTHDAKLYAASQTFDEARHVEVFGRYLLEKVGLMYPVNVHLKSLLDKILSDPRWDLKFIGMQIVIEGLALAAFNTMKMTARDPLLREIVELVIRDEARHVAFGVTYMEEHVKALSEAERAERALFAYEACVVMRERMVGTDVLAHFGWDVEAGRRIVLDSELMDQFRRFLFARIIPNLRRVGLLTDAMRPRYEELGILQYEDLLDDGEIDWAGLGETSR